MITRAISTILAMTGLVSVSGAQQQNRGSIAPFTRTPGQAQANMRQLQQDEACGKLVGCSLVDITNWKEVAPLLLEDVTYTIDSVIDYSIACTVLNGTVDEITILYGNGESHTEVEEPYWVGGETNAVPNTIPYLATPGTKVFDVAGVLGGATCFEHRQRIFALPEVVPTSEPTLHPTEKPTPAPTPRPTAKPTMAPVPAPVPVLSPRRSDCLSKGYTASQCASHGYRNRNLQTVSTSFLAEDHKTCMGVHYDMFLVAEGVHFAGLAVPIGQECPSVVFHSSIAGHDKSVEKVVMIADPAEVATFNTDSIHHLGSRPFGTILKAFENASVGKDGAKFYDSITNNCVSLLRNMAGPLDVPVDDAMIDFVTRKLLSTGDINLWDGIKNSPSLNLIVAGGKRMLKVANQEDLIRKLIKLYV